MAVFVITFRISEEKTVLGTPNERHNAVVNAILNGSTTYWSQTTSFFLLASSLTTCAELTRQIGDESFFDERADLLVCIDMKTGDHAVLGTNNDPDLHRLLAAR